MHFIAEFYHQPLFYDLSMPCFRTRPTLFSLPVVPARSMTTTFLDHHKIFRIFFFPKARYEIIRKIYQTPFFFGMCAFLSGKTIR